MSIDNSSHGAIMAFIAKFEGCYSPLQVHDSKRRAAGAAGKTAQISSAKGRGCNLRRRPGEIFWAQQRWRIFMDMYGYLMTSQTWSNLQSCRKKKDPYIQGKARYQQQRDGELLITLCRSKASETGSSRASKRRFWSKLWIWNMLRSPKGPSLNLKRGCCCLFLN